MRFLKGLWLAVAFMLGVQATNVALAADSVSTTTIRNAGGSFGGRYTFLFGNSSDGTGETAVTKVTAGGLSGSPNRLKITRIRWATNGLNVLVYFDGTADSLAMVLTGNGELDGIAIQDPWVAGHTGNLVFSTGGASAGDGYTIYIEATAVQ